MTRLQIISLIALIVSAGWTFLPKLKLPAFTAPAGKPDTLGHMRNVMAVRDSYESPEVKGAATALLQALLKV